MRTIVGNWKMQLTIREAEQLAREVAGLLGDVGKDPSVIVCPSYAALAPVGEAIAASGIMLGAQDVCDQEKGAWTGEVAARELVDLGAKAVIVGHSERRSHVHETDALVHAKVARALASGLMPIVCVGETRAERDDGKRDVVIERQVRAALDGVSLPRGAKVLVAYEPVWAIGTGQAVDPDDAARSHFLIKETLRDLLGPQAADRSCHVIYGGSVDRTNIDGFFARSVVEGVLVGGASLRAQDFCAIVDAARRTAAHPEA